MYWLRMMVGAIRCRMRIAGAWPGVSTSRSGLSVSSTSKFGWYSRPTSAMPGGSGGSTIALRYQSGSVTPIGTTPSASSVSVSSQFMVTMRVGIAADSAAPAAGSTAAGAACSMPGRASAPSVAVAPARPSAPPRASQRRRPASG